MRKKLPVGIEFFDEFFTQDFYYVDKTGFIRELLENWGKVNLFTRPRRFGKSLNMSMLKCFFQVGTNPAWFEGLNISKSKELCQEHLGKYPVIFISLKDVSGTDFQRAFSGLKKIIYEEALLSSFLSDSKQLTESEKKEFSSLLEIGQDGSPTMTTDTLISSLQMLSRLLSKHYQRKTIILIDEYDVPLDKAFQFGYYDEMVELIRCIFSKALKTNPDLQFAVLTGCLRISKESIFTGLNNPKVHTILDYPYCEYFGFTESDVHQLLTYYGLSSYSSIMKDWYDGYHFGNAFVYCPWDVINFCCDLLANLQAQPKNYWANSSGNTMVRRFIEKADRFTRQEIEQLVAGDCILKKLNMELTYSELDTSIENIWSVLFTTGYLTSRNNLEDGSYELVIPNREIHSLFVTQIQEWFKEISRKDTSKLETLCNAFLSGDTKTIEKLLNQYLWNGISIRDTAVRKKYKENFYHGMLFGLLQYAADWNILSNRESGDGYSDLLIETMEGTGIIIEVKYAEDGNLDAGCASALKQITDKSYIDDLKKRGMTNILSYGIAFYLKRCKIECHEYPKL